MGEVAGAGDRAVSKGFGLVRFTVTDGEVLEHIPLEPDVVPFSCACWFPGPAARVLFATGDGRLHRLDFDAGPDTRAGRFASPQRAQHLPWPATMAGRDGLDATASAGSSWSSLLSVVSRFAKRAYLCEPSCPCFLRRGARRSRRTSRRHDSR
jgi:hypothetical protein